MNFSLRLTRIGQHFSFDRKTATREKLTSMMSHMAAYQQGDKVFFTRLNNIPGSHSGSFSLAANAFISRGGFRFPDSVLIPDGKSYSSKKK